MLSTLVGQPVGSFTCAPWGHAVDFLGQRWTAATVSYFSLILFCFPLSSLDEDEEGDACDIEGEDDVQHMIEWVRQAGQGRLRGTYLGKAG